MPKQKYAGELKPEDLKYYVCMFKIDGHRTYRIAVHQNVDGIETQLKTQIGKHVVTEKKFFELDRITGTFEEF